MASPKKTVRLTETDLARVAVLPAERRYQALAQIKTGFPPLSYKAVRASFADILNISSGFLPATERTAWLQVREQIRKNCHQSKAERIANVQVGAGLYGYAHTQNVIGRAHDFRPLTIAGQVVTFWSNVVIRIDGKLYIPFFDPRRSRGLSREAMRFVFSAMDAHIRSADPDFADVGFVIFRFADTKRGPRQPIPYFDKDFELFSHDELDLMVRETYETLAQVLVDRAAEAPKKTA